MKALYETLTEEEKELLTDGCKIFSLKGEEVKLVRGELFNMKVTTPFDLKVANAILKEGINQ